MTGGITKIASQEQKMIDIKFKGTHYTFPMAI
jgi:hypothetical protein